MQTQQCVGICDDVHNCNFTMDFTHENFRPQKYRSKPTEMTRCVGQGVRSGIHRHQGEPIILTLSFSDVSEGCDGEAFPKFEAKFDVRSLSKVTNMLVRFGTKPRATRVPELTAQRGGM